MSNIHSLNSINLLYITYTLPIKKKKNLLYITNMTNKADGDIHRYAKMKLSVNMSFK
jgi:hypothetical protein